MEMLPLLILLSLQSDQTLFTIARTTNANVVHYDARLTPSGNLDPKTPVVAYWSMLAERGQREELSSIEKRSAYGFTVSKDASTGCLRLLLEADKDLPILVCSAKGSLRAEMMIAGRRAILQRMFIGTKGVAFWKSVTYVELFGKDINTGEPRYEKITHR